MLVSKLLAGKLMANAMMGGVPDEAVVTQSLPSIGLCLSEFERILGDGQWFGGEQLSLADIHLAPIMGYMTSTPESGDLSKPRTRLGAWWQRMSGRPSMAKTQPKFG